MMLSADALGRARAAGETVGTCWPVGGAQMAGQAHGG